MMALFKRKTASAEVTEQKSADIKKSTSGVETYVDVLKNVHVTEKAFALSEKNVYTFDIDTRANKYMVKTAIKSQYGVTPKKIRIVNRRPRVISSQMRKHDSRQKGLKKAYVYLNEGDTINLM